jgi:hypothetical protein
MDTDTVVSRKSKTKDTINLCFIFSLSFHEKIGVFDEDPKAFLALPLKADIRKAIFWDILLLEGQPLGKAKYAAKSAILVSLKAIATWFSASRIPCGFSRLPKPCPRDPGQV